MTTITIRHVPVEVRNELAARAARRGQSLQEFMLAELRRLASRPAVADLVVEIDRHKQRTGLQVDRQEILDDLRAERR